MTRRCCRSEPLLDELLLVVFMIAVPEAGWMMVGSGTSSRGGGPKKNWRSTVARAAPRKPLIFLITIEPMTCTLALTAPR